MLFYTQREKCHDKIRNTLQSASHYYLKIIEYITFLLYLAKIIEKLYGVIFK